MAPSDISPGSAATVLSFVILAGLQLETRFRVGEVLAAPRGQQAEPEPLAHLLHSVVFENSSDPVQVCTQPSTGQLETVRVIAVRDTQSPTRGLSTIGTRSALGVVGSRTSCSLDGQTQRTRTEQVFNAHLSLIAKDLLGCVDRLGCFVAMPASAAAQPGILLRLQGLCRAV